MSLHQLLFTVLFVLVAVSPVLTGRYSWGHPSRDWRQPDTDKLLPEFEMAPTSVTSLIGQTVFLQCQVKNLGDKVVSWIRTRDLHILTSGAHTFTSDARFAVNHRPESDVWTLRIMGAQPRDEGRYECQVNTDPKINFAVNLTVRESDMKDSPRDALGVTKKNNYESTVSATSILGPADQYVRLGSTVTFTCVVTAPYPRLRPPKTMSWYHGGRLVSFQAARGGISVDAEKTDVQTTSKLTVAAVTHGDAGNYTCLPTEMRPATVNLVIIEGEHTEAMQRDESSSSSPPSCFSVGKCSFVTFVCVVNWWCIHRCLTFIE